MAAKAATLPADEIVLDLEDAIGTGTGQKAAARAELVRLVEEVDFGGRSLAVRINQVGGAESLRDLVELVPRIGARLDCIVVPKVSRVAEIGFVEYCLRALESEAGLRRPIGLQLQIEGPAGLEAAPELAGSSDRLEALIFGPGDFASAMGMPQLAIGVAPDGYPGDIWHYPLYRIAVAARAHGLQVIDGPFAAIADSQGLDLACRRGAALGLDGKWAIHPSQLEPINSAFTPSPAQVERARAVVTQLEGGTGVASLDGEMIDGASLRMAATVLARAGRETERP
jgi:citrate lyase subunit beta/citryl-CoA lyase